MTYPLSSEVSGGQPTAADHYNNLRADALYLGAADSEAVPLGTALIGYRQNLQLELLDTDRVRLPASPLRPVILMINGRLLASVNNVDLPAGSRPSGAAAVWYVFAERSSAAAFTIDINTSDTESDDRRLIGQFYWDGERILPSSIVTVARPQLVQDLKYTPPLQVQGRLSLVSGQPAALSEVASASMLYFTPFRGNQVSLYFPGYGWACKAFEQLSLSLDGLSADVNRDVFLCERSSGLTLELAAWSSDDTRSEAISLRDGVWTSDVNPDYLYLGTFRTKSAGITCMTREQAFLFNACQPICWPLERDIDTAHWEVTSTTWEMMNSDSNNCVELVNGLPQALRFECMVSARNSAGKCHVGLGLDATDENDAQLEQSFMGSDTNINQIFAVLQAVIQPGYHKINMLQKVGSDTGHYYGSLAGFPSCLLGLIKC